MILLDTNVISELMRPVYAQAVFDWVASQPKHTLYTSTVVQAEILYGLACLDAGQRRDALTVMAGNMFAEFEDRVLPFDQHAALHYADIAADRQRQGRSMGRFDALIAATARAVGARVATRDTKGFADCGLTLINPWDEAHD